MQKQSPVSGKTSARRKNDGKNTPAKKGEKGRPDDKSFKKAQSAEYQGRKVQLGKPFRTPKGPKKMPVYVKNDKGNVVKVNFGDPNMKVKKSDPARRKVSAGITVLIRVHVGKHDTELP